MYLFTNTIYAFLFAIFFDAYIIWPFSSYTVNEISLLQYSKPSGEFPASSYLLKYSLILQILSGCGKSS